MGEAYNVGSKALQLLSLLQVHCDLQVMTEMSPQMHHTVTGMETPILLASPCGCRHCKSRGTISISDTACWASMCAQIARRGSTNLELEALKLLTVSAVPGV